MDRADRTNRVYRCLGCDWAHGSYRLDRENGIYRGYWSDGVDRTHRVHGPHGPNRLDWALHKYVSIHSRKYNERQPRFGTILDR
jgi:hypothetical protein